MKKENIKIGNIPAILYGNNSDKLFLFVHGRYSKKEEAKNFANIATKKDFQVLSFDLPKHGERKDENYDISVQNAIHDLKEVYSFVKDKYKSFSLYACSFGAYFSLIAYQNVNFDKCLFLSPILNMELLIQNMMKWANTTEEELKEKRKIKTSFGETLSWNYYEFVQKNPVEKWDNKTFILYGENDDMTSKDVLNSFVEKYNCDLEVLENGEHYFHTKEQLNCLNKWLERVIE